MSEKTYSGRVCLSKEETIKGWKLERIDGLPRAAAALKLHVSEKTLSRMYKRYGVQSPKCLSKEEVIEAWKLERIDGLTRAAAALKLRTSKKTLSRMYKRYNLPSPKRGKKI